MLIKFLININLLIKSLLIEITIIKLETFQSLIKIIIIQLNENKVKYTLLVFMYYDHEVTQNKFYIKLCHILYK